MIRKTNRLSLVEQVVQQIEQLIEHKQWAVGEKIPPEAQLMEQFDVSRNTLREAIRSLVHAGLLETKQGSGTTVRSTNALEVAFTRHLERTNVFETLEVRSALEQEGAALAARRRTDDQLSELKEAVDNCVRAAKARDRLKFVQKDLHFHTLVIQAANNSLLLEMYEHMIEALSSSIFDVTMSSETFDYDEEIHNELLTAIEQQDAVRARQSVQQYIALFTKRLKKMNI